MPIYFYSKKDGKRYSKDGNGIRRLKLVYNTEDFEYIYNQEFSDEGNCIICGNKTKFISFKKGYEKYCSACKASRKHCFIEGYAEFVKENFISLYKDIWKSTNCVVDPYDGKEYNCGKVTFSSYVLKYKSKYDYNSNFWLVEKECAYCGKHFLVSIFEYENTHTCIEHHAINNKCIHSFKTRNELKMFSMIELKHYCENISYKEFLEFLEENKEYICNTEITKDYKLLSIIKHLFSDNIILRNIIMDFFFFEKYKNKDNMYLYFKNIPIRVYKAKTIWTPVKYRWNDILIEKTPKCCFWCGNKISDITKYEVVELENGSLTFLEEYNLCDLKCRNEYYKLHNNYKSKLPSEVNRLKKKQSYSIKQKIKNGIFTPNIVNSLTRKSFSCEEYPSYKFRSSWELIFWYVNKDTFDYSSYEKVRIPYIDEKGEEHSYIIDFVDENNKILYEIKPKAKENDIRNVLKREEAERWCLTNDYKFVIINEDYFLNLIKNNIDFSFLGNKKDKVIKDFMRGII